MTKRKKNQQTFKESIAGKNPIYISELRMTVFPRPGETEKETRERYLSR